MAVTSIWRVHGWLGKLVLYVENPEKTENPGFFQKPDMTDKETQSLSDVIEYAIQEEKPERWKPTTRARKSCSVLCPG